MKQIRTCYVNGRDGTTACVYQNSNTSMCVIVDRFHIPDHIFIIVVVVANADTLTVACFLNGPISCLFRLLYLYT
jgi:hypothetical protein